jgi:hypothetical protein
MAPERLLSKKFGKKSDLYALGVIFYEMLTKKLPYISEAEIVSSSTSPRHPLPEWVPATLKDFVLKLMSKNKHERPTTLPSNWMKKTYTTNGGTYEGESRRWVGIRQGRGVMTYPDGRFYIGFFENDLKHGKGVCKDEDGSVYDGEWKEHKKHGKGKFIYPSGDIYKGQFKNDLPNGRGKYVKITGEVIVGLFKEGSFVS